MRPDRKWIAAGALLALAACTFDTGVPVSIALRCRDSSECPAGFVCRSALQRCIPAGSITEEAPTLVVLPALTVSNPAGTAVASATDMARRGSQIALTFEVTLPLGLEPKVFSSREDDPLRFELDEQGTDRSLRRFRFLASVDGTEPEGVRGLLIDLVDTVGNENAGIRAGALTLDFTPPALLADDPDLSASLVHPGQQVVVQIATSEPVQPGVELHRRLPDGSTRTVAAKSVQQSQITFTFSCADDEPSGLQHLSLRGLLDRAGNSGPEIDFESPLVLDGIPPVVESLFLIGSDTGIFSAQPDHRLVEFGFTADEPLHRFRVEIGHRSLSCDPAASTVAEPCRDPGLDTDFSCHCEPEAEQPTCRCRYRIVGDEVGTRDEIPVQIEVWDRAGNTGSSELPLLLDFAAPGIKQGTVACKIEPPPGSLMEGTTALASGGRVTASFTVDEPVKRVHLTAFFGSESNTPSDRWRVGDVVEEDDRHYTLELFLRDDLDVPPPQGFYRLEVELVDLVDNRAALLLDSNDCRPEVDTVAPSPPRPESLRLVRVPWGSEVTLGEPRFRGDAALDETGCLALDAPAGLQSRLCAGHLFYYGAPDGTEELGRCPIDGSTACLGLPFFPVDRERIYAAVSDRAGNLSSVVPVRQVTWTGTFGFKQPGEPTPNPHRAVGASAVDSGLLIDRVGALPVEEWGELELAHPDGTLAMASSARSFRRLRAATAGPGALDTAMVFDSTRGRIVATTRSDRPMREWEWQVWEARAASDPEADGDPRYNGEQAMVYDSLRNQVLLYGGLAGSHVEEGLWSWERNSWILLDTSTTPGPRHGHAMTLDIAELRVLLHGGATTPDATGSLADDTWGWDGQRWEHLAATGPGPRTGHAISYDATNEQVVLFGGFGCPRDRVPCATPDVMDDTWIWNAGSWSRRAPLRHPSARAGHRMVFDPIEGHTVLVGGDSVDGESAEIWYWDGENWSLDHLIAAPFRSNRSGLCYRQDTGQILLAGGLEDGSDELLALDRQTRIWQPLTHTVVDPVTGAGTRQQLILHTEQSRLFRLLLANRTTEIGAPGIELWSWNGHGWDQLTRRGTLPPDPWATAPGVRFGAGFAYSPNAEQAVLVGGYDEDGLLLPEILVTDRTRSGSWTWKKVVTGNFRRAGHSMVSDPAVGNVFIFGGSTSSDAADVVAESCTLGVSWAPHDLKWDGLLSCRTIAPSPSPRWYAALAPGVNAAGEAIVLLHGGELADGSEDGETWVFDPVDRDWEPLESGSQDPPPRSRHAMAYRAELGGFLMLGGDCGDRSCGDAWLWDGQWHPLAVQDREGDGEPLEYMNHALATDPGSSQLILMGESADSSGTWIMQPEGLPGHLLHFDLDSVGLGPDTRLTSAEVSLRTGGVWHLPEEDISGARLRLWANGAWRPLADHDASSEAPDWLGGSLTDPGVGWPTPFLNQGVYLSVTSLPGDGAGHGEVALDFAQLELTYVVGEDGR